MISKKLIAFFFCFSLCLTSVWNQTNGSIISLQDGLEDLSSLHDIHFAYDPQGISQLKVGKSILNVDLNTALELINQYLPITFNKVDEKHILVIKQSQFQITGKVFDQNTGMPLPYASIYVDGTGLGTETNKNGEFNLLLPDSLYDSQLQIRYLGYQTKSISPFEIHQVHQLQPTDNEITAIEIEATTHPIENLDQTGNYAISKELAPTYGITLDPIKQLQLLPGISANEDFSAGLNIRGSSNSDNLIVLNGINLYNVDHFYGIISAIQSSSVDTFTLYKNSFPVQYGGATGGVLNMTSRPAKDEIQGKINLSLLEGAVNLRIPITSELSVSLSARSSINNLGESDIYDQYHNLTLNNPLSQTELPGTINDKITSMSPDYSFYDGGINIYFKGHQLSFFSSQDHYNLKYKDSYTTKLKNINVFNIEELEEEEYWSNQGWSWQSKLNLFSKWSSHVGFNYSSYKNQFEKEAEFEKKFPKNIEIQSFENEFQSDVNGYHWTFSNLRTWSNQEIIWGSAINQHNIHNIIQNFSENIFEKKSSATIYSFFGSHSVQLNQQWKIKWGIRSNYYPLQKENYFSPRLEFKFYPNLYHSFFATFSHYQQFIRTITSEDGLGQSRELFNLADGQLIPVLTATNATIGWKKLWENGWVFEMEGYYKLLNGIVEYAPLFNNPIGNASNRKPRFTFFEGKGKIRGLDVLLRKSTNHWGWLLAYTLSKNTHTFPRIANNTPFPAATDRRHQLNWAGHYRWKKWTFSSTFNFASGRPYTDLKKITEFLSENPRTFLSPNDRISYLKNYQRWDFKINYTPSNSNKPWFLGVGIYNILNRPNVAYRQYAFVFSETRNDPSFLRNTIAGNEVYMLGRTLTFDFQYSF